MYSQLTVFMLTRDTWLSPPLGLFSSSVLEYAHAFRILLRDALIRALGKQNGSQRVGTNLSRHITEPLDWSIIPRVDVGATLPR